jgi:hypothetical protein
VRVVVGAGAGATDVVADDAGDFDGHPTKQSDPQVHVCHRSMPGRQGPHKLAHPPNVAQMADVMSGHVALDVPFTPLTPSKYAPLQRLHASASKPLLATHCVHTLSSDWHRIDGAMVGEMGFCALQKEEDSSNTARRRRRVLRAPITEHVAKLRAFLIIIFIVGGVTVRSTYCPKEGKGGRMDACGTIQGKEERRWVRGRTTTNGGEYKSNGGCVLLP